jgi:rhodanese-related sulfurtransferase
MKKISISFLAILSTISFTACGGGGGSDSTVDISESGKKQTPAGIIQNIEQNPIVSPSPVGPFTTAGDFGVVNLSTDVTNDPSEDYPFGKDVLFLDIRNQWEREYLGYPKGSIGGAVYEYREHDGDGNEISGDRKYEVRKSHKKEYEANFVKKVKEYTNNDLNKKIILICASGSRTGAHKGGPKEKDKDSAAKLLSKNGFTNVYHIEGGFGAWDNAGLDIVEAIK